MLFNSIYSVIIYKHVRNCLSVPFKIFVFSTYFRLSEDIVVSTGIKAVLHQYELFTDQNTRNRDLMNEVCIPHMIPRAWEQQGWSKRKKHTQE